MKRWIANAVLLGMLAGLAGCASHSTYRPPQLLEPVGVEWDTAQVKQGDIYNRAVYTGEVVPYVQALHFVTDGSLGRCNVLPGDEVKQGQVLATLDGGTLHQSIAALEAEIDHLTATGNFSDRKALLDIQIAEEELAILRKSDAGPEACALKQVDIEILQAGLRQAREVRSLELEQKNKQLEALKAQQTDMTLEAPFDGCVVYVTPAMPGDWVGAYSAVICIADQTRLSLVSEYIPSTVTKTGRVFARIGDSEYALAEVPYGDGEMIAMTMAGEKVNTKFAFAPDAQGLESGQFAAVIAVSSYRENALVVPINALYRDTRGRYVYKVVDGQRVRCEVEVGLLTDIEAEILEGLQEGDVVYVKE